MKNYQRIIIEGRIAEAYGDLSTAAGWKFASIRELREALSDVATQDLDAVLTGLYEQQVINLVPQSNQQALTDADRAAALRIGGVDKHLVCWG